MKSGQKQIDESLEVWVSVNPEDESALKELVGQIATTLDQEAIYLERVESSVEFVEPLPNGDECHG